MEITIKVVCPKCNEEIEFYNRVSPEVMGEHKKYNDMLFDMGKKAAESVMEGEKALFEDFFRIIEEYKTETPKAIGYIRDYFDLLETKIRTSDDPRELLKLSNKLVKTKVTVSKPVLKEAREEKRRVLEALKRRVKELKSGKKEKMKFNCIKCGKFICSLDMGRFENKNEHPLYCKDCLKENLGCTRSMFNWKEGRK